MESQEFEKCLLCGSGQILTLSGYEKHYLVECRNCHFVFCKRIPSSEELLEHYSRYPRATALSPITRIRYQELLDTFEPFRKNGRILDIGCGDGHFLEEAKKRDWKVYGTEFTPEAVSVCEAKGIEMRIGKLESSHYAPGFFDVVTSFEVMEHINDPAEEAIKISAILRKEGLLYVTTPNFNSISRNIAGAAWNIIEYPEHLSYFTRGTLKRLLRHAGLVDVKVTTTGVSLSRLKRTRSLPGESTGNSDESLREKIEGNFFLLLVKSLINFMLNIFGKGDAMKGYFQKK